MKIRLPFALLTLAFLLPAAGAQAHDALQSNTNVWLRPDQLEIELFMARVPSRALVDNPPKVPVVEDNFASTYHVLLQQSAATMFEVTLDGKKIAPTSITVALFEETDLRFDFLYPRPASGRLRVTSPFVKKMDEGYINTLSYFQDGKALSDGLLTSDYPAWEITLGLANNPPQPGAQSPLPSSTPASPAKPPTPSNPTPGGHDSYFIIPHFHNLTYVAAAAVILVIVFLVGRKKNDNVPPET